ncbi:hypothetical protein P20652_1915 [Pseudoalteromonas sp. BSi20652]|uniref:WbqC family protein n=1 Tax=Pseudoalteromonas sp. BSi20652 TaxID=388384 RepID=UPI0002319678|nr:WbqC family protein [Pseudoalteromonas sp. BSi20652]GAA60051.1 hypothetical protein P20652_1915 [Pseudoalteromonas sp. BSi20652]
MLLSMMQPTYLPWLGYFGLINSADKFVFLDNVKLEKSDWHVRNKIKSGKQELMLTCPVSTPKGRMTATIENTQFVSANPWRRKHLKSIAESYAKAPFFSSLFPLLDSIYKDESITCLAQMNIKIIRVLMGFMNITTPTFIASQLKDVSGVKDARLVSICNELECDTYLSPVGAQAYIEKETPGGALVKNGIDVFYQNFIHPKYPQVKGEFISHLSVIDCLFNVGPVETVKLIDTCTRAHTHYQSLLV